MTQLLFHGTDHATAAVLADRTSQVDVTRGGGEFGCGFYVAYSAPVALRFAIGRFGVAKARALQLSVDAATLTGLTWKILTAKEAKKLRQRLRNAKTTRTHAVGADAVRGPIEGQPHDLQCKFEGPRSRAILNDSALTSIELVK